MVRGVDRGLFFTRKYPVLVLFLEKIILSSLNNLGTCVKNQVTIYMGVYIWTLCHLSLFLLSPMSVFIKVTFYYTFKSDSMSPPALFFSYFKLFYSFKYTLLVEE